MGNGTVVAWGANDQGQLGDGTTTNRARPVTVAGVSGATSIAAGDNNSIAIGAVPMIWGSNRNGQLGLGSLAPAFRSSAAQLSVSVGGAIIEFAIGAGHVLAARNDGSVWAWGANDGGQIGNGSVGGNVLEPAVVRGLNLN